MKKVIFIYIFILCFSMIFSACSNRDNYDNKESSSVLTSETSLTTETSSYNSSEDNHKDVSISKLVTTYDELINNKKYELQYTCAVTPYLADFDFDNVPELILQYSTGNTVNIEYAVFTYKNSEAIYIGNYYGKYMIDSYTPGMDLTLYREKNGEIRFISEFSLEFSAQESEWYVYSIKIENGKLNAVLEFKKHTYSERPAEDQFFTEGFIGDKSVTEEEYENAYNEYFSVLTPESFKFILYDFDREDKSILPLIEDYYRN